jgi:hypothetical protein
MRVPPLLIAQPCCFIPTHRPTRPLLSHGQEPMLVAILLPLRWALGGSQGLSAILRADTEVTSLRAAFDAVFAGLGGVGSAQSPDEAVCSAGGRAAGARTRHPRNGDGRAELDREFAGEEAPFSGGRFVVKIVAPIR